MSLIINDKKVAGLYKAYVIQNATNTASGIIRIATEEEVKAGLDSLTAVTPKQLATKQDVLIAGNGLEILEDGTINNTQTSAEWGNIIGNILDQEDLNAILLTKANEEETAYELVYENSILTLKNRKGDTLSEVSINELPDVDNVTIVINEENKLQSIGEKTKSGTFKYTWIGTESEYTDAKDLGIIDEFTECIIIDSEAEKVVPIVQYEAPTKLSQLANDIEYVTNDELQSVKTSLENKIDLQTDGAEIVHRVGNETIDGFKNFKQKIVIENGLGKGRIAHKPLNSSLEDGYIEFGDNTLLYGKQNIQGELYDEKHDIFHAGNLVAGNNITITEKDGVYKINGNAGGGTGGGSIDNVDNETIIIQDDGSISAQGVLDQNTEDLTAIKFWSGTLEEYEALGEWDDDTIYNVTDDVVDTGGLAELPIASTDTLGGVKVDGKTIKVTEEGVISAGGGGGLENKLTNCLLEVPQNIKLELNDGVLTLKAGSVVIVPNGFESDGVTPKFDELVIGSDMTVSTTGGTGPIMVTVQNGNYANATGIQNCISGSNVEPKAYSLVYNTTNNTIIRYSSDPSSGGSISSFPIAICTQGEVHTITSLDQVFNGFGYIGSTIWVDKGVKGLAPIGRNEDGSLKNDNWEFTEVVTRTITGTSKGDVLALNYNEPSVGFKIGKIGISSFHYDEKENQNINKGNNNAIWSYTPVATIAFSNGVISNFQPKLAFRAVDWNDIKINNPYFFGQYIWSEFAPDNLSWLKSSGQWNSGSGYQSFYDWILSNANANKAGFKLSTASYTHYDFVVNTSAKTFRLPVKVQNTPMGGTAPVVGNGLGLGLTNGTYNFTPTIDSGSQYNRLNWNRNAYGTNVGAVTSNSYVDSPNLTTFGVTTDATNSGLIADLSLATNSNLSLYFYVGETVKDPALIDVSQIASNFADKVDIQQASGAGMPSKRYINLTLGASDTEYTASVSGWIYWNGNFSAASGIFRLNNLNTGLGASVTGGSAYSTPNRIFFPIKKGDKFQVTYTNVKETYQFRLYYAEGEV